MKEGDQDSEKNERQVNFSCLGYYGPWKVLGQKIKEESENNYSNSTVCLDTI